MELTPSFIRRHINHRTNLLKIIDNVGWLFIDKILRMGIGLIVGVWLARHIGPEKFGLLSFATAFVGLLGIVAGLGLQEIVVRDIVRDPTSKEETLGSAAALQFLGGLGSYALILAVIFGLRPDDQLAIMIVAILGSIVLFKASEVVVYWFESQVQSKYTVWVQNSSFLIFAAVKIGLILNNATLVAFAWAMMAEALMVALLLGIMLGLRGPRLYHLRITPARAKGLLKDSWPLLLSGIAIVVYMKIDQIMLGQMIGDEEVGIYSAALRVSEVWYVVPVIIISSVFPTILETKKRSKEEYYQLLQRLYDLMLCLSVGIALPLTFLSIPIVTLLFGEAYTASGSVLAVHIWTALFVFQGAVNGKFFLIENLQKLVLSRAISGSFLNIFLNLLLIPIFSAYGAALATLITALFVNFLVDVTSAKTKPIFFMKLRSISPQNTILNVIKS